MFRGFSDFRDVIKNVLKDRPRLYQTITLDLSTARSNEAIALTGSYFKVIAATDLNANIQVKFNSTDADDLTFNKQTGAIMPFVKLFISNAAQVGKSITYVVGLEGAPLELINNSSVVDIQGITDPVKIRFAGTTQYLYYEWTVPAASGYYDTAIYTVPAGKRAILTQYSAYAAFTSLEGDLRVKVRVNTNNIDFLASSSKDERTMRCGLTGIELVAGDVAKFTVANNDSTARLVRGSMTLNEYSI